MKIILNTLCFYNQNYKDTLLPTYQYSTRKLCPNGLAKDVYNRYQLVDKIPRAWNIMVILEWFFRKKKELLSGFYVS